MKSLLQKQRELESQPIFVSNKLLSGFTKCPICKSKMTVINFDKYKKCYYCYMSGK